MADEAGIRADAEAECEKLRRALEELREENRSLKRCLAELLFEELEVNDDELLTLAKSRPPFETLIHELETIKG